MSNHCIYKSGKIICLHCGNIANKHHSMANDFILSVNIECKTCGWLMIDETTSIGIIYDNFRVNNFDSFYNSCIICKQN